MWTLTFRSETNKPLAYSEDATEYGSVVIEGKRDDRDTEYKSRTRSIGTYELYAPGTVNNSEWVLYLSKMAHYEKERFAREGTWNSGVLSDDILIVEFRDQERDSFQLHWSNHSSKAWGSLVPG